MGETVGQAVKRLREAKGWSQRDLAAKALVSAPFIAMLETGVKGRASVAVLRRFERVLGAPYGALEALAHLPKEWWRAEPDRELGDPSQLRSGPFFATRHEADEEARRRGWRYVVRYQNRPGSFTRRAFPLRGAADAGDTPKEERET